MEEDLSTKKKILAAGTITMQLKGQSNNISSFINEHKINILRS